MVILGCGYYVVILSKFILDVNVHFFCWLVTIYITSMTRSAIDVLVVTLDTKASKLFGLRLKASFDAVFVTKLELNRETGTKLTSA